MYGQNGSGKSSYVRLLKHISGAKKMGRLMGNVYVDENNPQQCSLTITTDEETRDIVWNPELGVLDELSALQLYDTDCANVYVNEENEVAYEPWILQFLTQLTNACVDIGQAIKHEMDLISLIPLTPPETLKNTQLIKWLDGLSDETAIHDINTQCRWTEKDEAELKNKSTQLSETDPSSSMKRFSNIAKGLEKLHELLCRTRDSLNETACREVIDARNDYEDKRKAADQDATRVFEGLPLEGVGTDSWKLLWEHARKFSEEHAYPSATFPNTSAGSHCVLCHQPLAHEAQGRLNSFESYVKASLNQQANTSKEHLEKMLKDIEEVPNETTLALHFSSITILSEEEQRTIIDFCTTLQKRSDSLRKAISETQLSPLPISEVLVALRESAAANQQQALEYEKLARSSSREELKSTVLELEARRWLHENQAVICDNVGKLQLITKYKTALSFTNTQALSAKKSAISDELISKEYTNRFQQELRHLGGSRIKVDLVKTRAQRGHVYHQVQLRDCAPSVRTSEILSEGEFRIVSLAGFLADVEGASGSVPFVFDDPISSLDQLFEEATVKRIARLSQSRQVIVFTHRLSFVTLLEEAAGELGIKCDTTWLRSESWGVGEPGETPVFAKRPERALNQLLNGRLKRAQKVLNEQGRTEYDLLAKGICSDFRILIERFIENDLLADVVQRFRRSVTTQGKINKLARISVDDCEMFDDYMTKYSKYEHSQPYEAPVMLPEPDELEEDMRAIKYWLDEFTKRTVS